MLEPNSDKYGGLKLLELGSNKIYIKKPPWIFINYGGLRNECVMGI